MAGFFNRVKTLTQDVKRHGTQCLEKRETKTMSSDLRDQGARLCGLKGTEATLWSWAIAKESGLKKGLFRKEAPGSKIRRPAFRQAMGRASGYSLGHGVNTSPCFLSVGNSDPSAQKSQAPGNSQQGVTCGIISIHLFVCLEIVKRPNYCA